MSPRSTKVAESEVSQPGREGEPGLPAVLAQLHRLRDLPRGWNGYDAAPIDPLIIGAAERFIHDLPGEFTTTPRVVPMTRGRLQLEWDRGDRSLELEFETPDSVHYLKWDSGAGIEEEDVLDIREARRLLELLEWFSAGPRDVG